MNRLTTFAMSMMILNVGCAGTVTIASTEPDGCAIDADCSADEFCLAEWSIAPGGPRDVHECKPRGGADMLCLADTWCAEGFVCDRTPEAGGVCAPDE